MTILFFPNGTIQCVGNSSDTDAEQVHAELCEVLHLKLPMWEVKSITVVCILNRTCDFRRLCSNQNVTYEVELFPAAQMSLWRNVHVHLFHNGKMIITGITDVSQVSLVVNDVVTYFNKLNV